MADWWSSYRAGLDPIFAENADELSLKLDMLKFGEKMNPGDLSPLPDDWQPDPPLQAYDEYSFFDPSAALSGQDLGLFEELHSKINQVWMLPNETVEIFDSRIDYMLSHWEGDAAGNCSAYKGSLVAFVHRELQCLEKFAHGLAVYAAIIQEARRGLNELMGACVNGWTAVSEQKQAAGTRAAITILTGLTGVAIGVATGGAALPAFTTMVGMVAGAAGNISVDLAGANHADVADAYLQASSTLISDAAEAIRNNAIGPLTDEVLAGLPDPPQLHGDLTDHGQFHPRSEPSANVTSPAPASVIQHRLG